MSEEWTMNRTGRLLSLDALRGFDMLFIMGFRVFAVFFFGGLAALLPDAWSKTVILAATLGFEWLFLYLLYRKNVFLLV